MAAIVEELVEKISGLTLMEASELKKALEDKFGVTAAAPVNAIWSIGIGSRTGRRRTNGIHS